MVYNGDVLIGNLIHAKFKFANSKWEKPGQAKIKHTLTVIGNRIWPPD